MRNQMFWQHKKKYEKNIKKDHFLLKESTCRLIFSICESNQTKNQANHNHLQHGAFEIRWKGRNTETIVTKKKLVLLVHLSLFSKHSFVVKKKKHLKKKAEFSFIFNLLLTEDNR